MASGTQTSTEPSASTIDWKPRKFSTMKWSMWMFVLPSTVRMRQAGPPREKLAFHCRIGPSATGLFGFLQSAGAWVIESRGTLTTTADFRSHDRCTIRVVSERAPDTCAAVPNALVSSPARESEPITRMFIGGKSVILSALLDGRLPRRPETSSLVMLLLSLK